MVHSKTGALAVVAALLISTSAMAQDQRVLKYNADYDPIPLAAMEALIADFEAANPDIDVQLNNFDHEGYKTAIRNFLSADSPDLANWYAGNRMAPFVKAGQFMDVSDVWEANGLGDSLASPTPTTSGASTTTATPTRRPVSSCRDRKASTGASSSRTVKSSRRPELTA